MKEVPELGEKLHPRLEFLKADVVWAVKNEMARSVKGVLARRVRILFLNAKATREMSPEVARIMAQYLSKDEIWQNDQIAQFSDLARQYMLINDKLFLQKVKATLKVLRLLKQSFVLFNNRKTFEFSI